MELFKQTKIDWLAKKWWFASISIFLFLLGVVSFVRSGLNYGIDFTGGTIIVLKFQEAPAADKLRTILSSESSAAPTIQRYGDAARHTVQVRLQKALGTGVAYEKDKNDLVATLQKNFDPAHAGSAQQDFNNVGATALQTWLIAKDPDGFKNQNKTIQETETHYDNLVKKILGYRDDPEGADGLLTSLDNLKAAGASPAVIDSLKQGFYAGTFAIKGMESIGAVVGSDLRRRAMLAVLLSLAAMLVYIAIRFKPIYGVAAIIALFHDVVITLGLFSITQKEISLTVIAALLTLVGYSVNDTIVIFDRVRENVRLMRKESIHDILNLSINQTLSRTIMTSGSTFIATLSLLVFGGDVLNGFAFALTAGIILGTYSTVALASTVVDWWYNRTTAKTGNKKK